MASLLDNFPLFGPFSPPNSQSSSSRWRPHDEEARRQAMDSWGGHPQHEGRWGPGSPPAWRTSWREQRSDRKTSSEVDIPVRKYQEPQRATSSEDKPLRCPYRPDDSDYNEPSTPPPSTRNLEDRDPWQFIAMDFALPRFAASFHTWPAAAYLMLSPYSPLALENKEHFREEGDKWRHAFEDLLDVQNGNGLRTRPARPEQRSGADWLQYMLTRRAFEPVNEKRIAEATATKGPESDHDEECMTELDLYKILIRRSLDPVTEKRIAEAVATREPESEGEEESMTELDLYECFLGKQFPSSAPKPVDTPKISTLPIEDKPSETTELTTSNKPSVVSTMTTTERTTLPDGRVYSRMVLKKRFADGREESSETVQTNDASEGLPRKLPVQGSDGVMEASARQTERAPEKTQKKGWFWS